METMENKISTGRIERAITWIVSAAGFTALFFHYCVFNPAMWGMNFLRWNGTFD